MYLYARSSTAQWETPASNGIALDRGLFKIPSWPKLQATFRIDAAARVISRLTFLHGNSFVTTVNFFLAAIFFDKYSSRSELIFSPMSVVFPEAEKRNKEFR